MTAEERRSDAEPAPARSRSSALSIGLSTPFWPLGDVPNGVVTYVSAVAPAIASLGHHVSLLTSRANEPAGPFPIYETHQPAARRQPAGGRVLDSLWYRLAPRAAWLGTARRGVLRAVRRMVAEQHLDVLELEEFWGIGSWVRRACGVSVHVRLHGPWFLNGPAVGAPDDAAFRQRVRLEGAAIAEAEAISAPSRDVLDRVRARYGLRLEQAEVIYNPAHPVPARDRWRAGDCDRDRLLFIGRFDRHKGGDVVIDAFARILAVRPRTRLTFVGPDRGLATADGRSVSLEELVRARLPGALEDGRIEWLGAQPFSALAALRRRAFLTLVASRYENQPGTVVEAMTMGCPVVAAGVGGIPELVQHGVNGLLHRGGDPQDLAEKVLEGFADPPRAERLGARAAADAERRHHPDVIALQLERMLLRTIGGRRRGG
jgi:glycosyltransferase involved in cell wall biosynthesis